MGVKEVARYVKTDYALRGSRRVNYRAERGGHVRVPLGLGTHVLTKNDHLFSNE
jgi:hypothetical protein